MGLLFFPELIHSPILGYTGLMQVFLPRWRTVQKAYSSSMRTALEKLEGVTFSQTHQLKISLLLPGGKGSKGWGQRPGTLASTSRAVPFPGLLCTLWGVQAGSGWRPVVLGIPEHGTLLPLKELSLVLHECPVSHQTFLQVLNICLWITALVLRSESAFWMVLIYIYTDCSREATIQGIEYWWQLGRLRIYLRGVNISENYVSHDNDSCSIFTTNSIQRYDCHFCVGHYLWWLQSLHFHVEVQIADCSSLASSKHVLRYLCI